MDQETTPTTTTKVGAVLTGDINKLSPSSRLIVETAFLRGVSVRIRVPEKGLFNLSYKGKTIQCSGSLTENTSVIAEKICYDKQLTNTLLQQANISVPPQISSTTPQGNADFLKEHGSIVIKPLSQSFGNGISVDVTDSKETERLVANLKINGDEKVLLERFVTGEDVRIIVIDNVYTAAIHRSLPSVTGNGTLTVRELIKKYNTNRQSHNSVPFNFETERCIALSSHSYDSVPPQDMTIVLRKNANEHTGGIAADVTDSISPALRSVAEEISRIIDIPVVGIDFIVPHIDSDEYTVIEVNSRPGLDGHEPQPVVDSFLNYLFPDLKRV